MLVPIRTHGQTVETTATLAGGIIPYDMSKLTPEQQTIASAP